jgi:hypothetical protein
VKRLVLHLLALLLLTSACAALAAQPTTTDDLLASGRLGSDSAIRPVADTVPGQKLRLILEIATDRWFTGGTRIGIPEVPGLVILQTEQFANNASETRDGQSWVVQRWTLDVYAQRPGSFDIPPIPLDIKVNAGEAGEIAGRVSAPPVTFVVGLPDSLAGAERWVAAPEFRVEQRFDRPLEGLQEGDAFEREITFEAADVMAMMLPVFAPKNIAGLATYPAPPALEDRSNRGATVARRTERISYVVEAAGHYLLPARDYLWWNTQTRKLQVLSLPATEIRVGTGVAGTSGPDTGGELVQLIRQRGVLILASLVLLAGALWLVVLLRRRLPLERASRCVRNAMRTLADLRKPALPRSLNPGSSAGE